MSEVVFAKCRRASRCKRCDLSSAESVTNACVPMRPHRARGEKQALLVVGEAPGNTEDLRGVCFVGDSGKILEGWLSACRWKDVADVYLTNALRCRLPKNHKPSKKQFDACRPYLETDISSLSEVYEEVSVLCVGAVALKSIGFSSVAKGLARQGDPAKIGKHTVRLFSTYHPASTLPGRNPNSSYAIADHFDLMMRSLAGEVPQESYGTPKACLCPAFPFYPVKAIALDIETYGAVKSFGSQTVFHPVRSKFTDGVLEVEDLIRTVAIAWKDPYGVTQSGTFWWDELPHYMQLLHWMTKAGEDRIPVVFMNAQFDLQYLRYVSKACRRVLDPDKLIVEDVAAWNYLFCDMRAERSLKTIAPLLGVAKYDGGKKEFKRYKSYRSRGLAEYNQKDAAATLDSRAVLMQQIREQYPETRKISKRTRNWYSKVIWVCTMMSEAGVCFDEKKLRKLRREKLAKQKSCRRLALRQYDLRVGGKGSQASIQEVVDEGAEEAGLVGDRDLVWTDKTNKISTKDGNLELISLHLGPGAVRNKILLLQNYRSTTKLISTYITPLIGPFKWKSAKRPPSFVQELIGGIAYPSWYAVPSFISDNDRGASGGTKQSRITCKKPALQTSGKEIQNCYTSRFPGGVVMKIDLSQIELRIAAIISGDKSMLKEFERLDSDIHTQMAIIIFGEGVTRKKDFHDVQRQLAKKTNFLILYFGSANVMRQVFFQELGLDVPIERCRKIRSTALAGRPGYVLWGNLLIQAVSKKGYYADPILGQGRVFLRSPRVNKTDYESTIVNFPIQHTAANLMLDVQHDLMLKMHRKRMKSLIGLNVYDSVQSDCVPEEVEEIEEMFKASLSSSDYRRRIEDYYGRAVPILYDTSKVQT